MLCGKNSNPQTVQLQSKFCIFQQTQPAHSRAPALPKALTDAAPASMFRRHGGVRCQLNFNAIEKKLVRFKKHWKEFM